MAASATSDFGLPRRSGVLGKRAHDVRLEVDGELLLHSGLQLDAVARVECRLPRDHPHALLDHVRLHGFVIGLVDQHGKGVYRRRSFGRDRLVRGKFWLTPDPGIVRIVVG